MMSCEFFSFESREPELLPPPYFNISSGSVGLFNHFDYEGGNPTTCDQTYDYNIYFKIAQFAAIVGPAGAALAFFFNVMEWCCCKLQLTFFLTFFLLFLGFVGQGMTFMVYGQTEFCFDDNATEDCSLELGAYLSIAAASAFYAASVMWCCMPRAQPIMQRGRKSASGDSDDTKRDVEEPQKPVDRDAPPDAEGSHTWQSFDKSAFGQSRSGSGSYEDEPEPEYASSSHFQGDSTTTSPTVEVQQQSPYEQQQQQQQQPSPTTTSSYYQQQQQPPPPQQQQDPTGHVYSPAMQPTSSPPAVESAHDDFANPFEDGAEVQNYERPSSEAYNASHP